MHGHPTLAVRPEHAIELRERVCPHHLGHRVLNLGARPSHDLACHQNLRVRIDRASVHKTAQSPKTSFKDIIGTLTVDLGNKPDTASVMLVLAVVESGKFV